MALCFLMRVFSNCRSNKTTAVPSPGPMAACAYTMVAKGPRLELNVAQSPPPAPPALARNPVGVATTAGPAAVAAAIAKSRAPASEGGSTEHSSDIWPVFSPRTSMSPVGSSAKRPPKDIRSMLYPRTSMSPGGSSARRSPKDIRSVLSPHTLMSSVGAAPTKEQQLEIRLEGRRQAFVDESEGASPSGLAFD